MRRLLYAALALAIVMLFLSPRSLAWAHSVSTESSIAPGSLLAAVPPNLTIRFSENVVASLSNLRVIGPQQIDASYGLVRQTPDARALSISLRPEGGGTYTVAWTAVSAEDGQVSAGSFYFAVGYVSHAGDLQSLAPVHGSSTLRVTGWLAAVTEWLLLLAAIFWTGSTLFELPPGTPAARPATAGGDSWLALVADRSRLQRSRVLEVLLGLLVFSWLLAAARLTLGGQTSLLGAIAHIFFSGHLGALHLLLLLTPLLALLDLRRSPATAPQTAGSRRVRVTVAGTASRYWRLVQRLPAAGRWGHFAVAMIFLFALAASGHAGGVPDLTLSAVILAWLHIVAAAAWFGSLAYLVFVALPAVENLDLDRRAPLMLGLLRRLIPFSLCAVAVLAISGLFAAQTLVGSAHRLTGTRYGLVVDLKLLLTLLALVLTLFLLGTLRGRLESLWAQRQRLESLHTLRLIGRIQRLLTTVGALLLAASAVLVWTVPPAATALPSASLPPGPVTTAAWQPVGLAGMAVYRLRFDPYNRHILWAATNKGVWLSLDDQQNWSLRGSTLAHLTVYDLLFLDGDQGLLAAASDGHLYRSYDAGKHWQKLDRPFGTHPLRALATNGRVLVAAGDDGIFRSTDDSKHWHRILALRPPGVSALYWSTTSGQFLAGIQAGPWQLLGAGADAASWHVLPNAPGVPGGISTLAQTAGDMGRLFVGTSGNSVWAAETPQSPWAAVRTGLGANTTVASLLIDTQTPGRIYLGTSTDGPFVSQDGGTSWEPLGASAPSAALFLTMRPGPTRMLYTGTQSGVYKLTIGP